MLVKLVILRKTLRSNVLTSHLCHILSTVDTNLIPVIHFKMAMTTPSVRHVTIYRMRKPLLKIDARIPDACSASPERYWTRYGGAHTWRHVNFLWEAPVAKRRTQSVGHVNMVMLIFPRYKPLNWSYLNFGKGNSYLNAKKR
jgi:hypothetical protein